VQVEQGRILDGGPAAASRTLVDVLRRSVARHPESSAIEDDRGGVSYRELWTEVTRIARDLAAEGIGPGSRVGVRLPSGSRDL
jgi:non-ribosomal peptide synthetase component E (peptide arylation enzyme)